ncbi:hypothetical protein CCHL11_08614 [Colletotrichum chlorophyti]|uniref:T6SS Phospholipase effector Tle1-like catalytic domain-containing protein n=1 Tax=Colletotrichum chlorophyti TaxID=708187 RepID=A0A1Q8RC20_9PEZI|nr:hypothetical protein CCHL11_08614 [Colletotrichum chlorophyti]
MASETTDSSHLWRSFAQGPLEFNLRAISSTTYRSVEFGGEDSVTIVKDSDISQVKPSENVKPSKRIIVCCDGTWQTSTTTKENIPSNVTRLARSIARNGRVSNSENPAEDDVIPQVVFYNAGIGTGDGVNILERGRQASFGNGLISDVIKAYHFIVNNYSPHDEIFCFGFSRGAYTARAVAGLITDIGIIQPQELDDFPKLYELYRKHEHGKSFKFRQSKAYRQWITGIRQPGFEHLFSKPDEMDDHWKEMPHNLPPEFTRVVNVVGVFDTVGALGVPGLTLAQGVKNFIADYIPFSAIDSIGFHNPTLSRYVKHAYHAMALDERRTPFTPTLWRLPQEGEQCACYGDKSPEQLARDLRKLLAANAPEEKLADVWEALIESEMAEMLATLDEIPDLQQVWFPGTHLNIGGGNIGIIYGTPFDCEQLALISFTWMCDQISGLLQLNDQREGESGSTLADREIAARKKLIASSRMGKGLFGFKSPAQLGRAALSFTGLISTDEGNDAWALGPIIDPISMVMRIPSFGLVLADRTPGEYKKDRAENAPGITNEKVHPSVFYRKSYSKGSYNPASLKQFERQKTSARGRKNGQVQNLYEWRKGNLAIPEYVIKPEDYISRRLAECSKGGKEFVEGLVTDHRMANGGY